MRLATVFAALLVLASAGCKPVPKEQQLPVFKQRLRLYFNEANRDAQTRKENLWKEQAAADRNPSLNPPTGTTFSTFTWDEEGYVVENFKCQVCGVRLLLPVPSAEYLCKSCGHCPYKIHPRDANLKASPCATCLGPDGLPKPLADDAIRAQVDGQKLDGCVLKEMFQLTQEDVEKPLEAKVRYVRRLWVFDQRGAVPVSQKILDKAKTGPIETRWIPREDATGYRSDREVRYTLPGYHRLDGEYIGEITFRFKGGEIIEIARLPEQPVRPWKDLKAASR